MTPQREASPSTRVCVCRSAAAGGRTDVEQLERAVAARAAEAQAVRGEGEGRDGPQVRLEGLDELHVAGGLLPKLDDAVGAAAAADGVGGSVCVGQASEVSGVRSGLGAPTEPRTQPGQEWADVDSSHWQTDMLLTRVAIVRQALRQTDINTDRQTYKQTGRQTTHLALTTKSTRGTTSR